MQGFNHVAGGVAFTGIFASFADVNVFSAPALLGGTLFFSLLPDIDHTRSPMGKAFWPLARWLDTRYGHRTITHSLLFTVALLTVVQAGEWFTAGTSTFTMVAGLAYTSHLIFDMCTRSGIPFFMPFTTARCVLPGNPNLRLSSADVKAEIVVFFVFVGLIFTALPLMSQGFWTSYNRTFATFSHLHQEHRRADDLLHVRTQAGQSGYVVKAEETKAVLFGDGQFIHITRENSKLAELIHTGRAARVEDVQFISITGDSLRQLLAHPVLSLKCMSTGTVTYRIAGEAFEKNGIDLEYQTGFDFIEVQPDVTADREKLIRNEAAITEATRKLEAARKEQAAKRGRIAELERNYATMSAYEQGKAQEETRKLREELAREKLPEVAVSIEAARRENEIIKQRLSNQKHLYTGIARLWKL